MSNFESLIKNVFQWGIDRDLYKYSTVPVQLVKLVEEFFEYQEALEALSDTNSDDESRRLEIDSIGDMLVVALNLFGVEQYRETGKNLSSDELLYSLLNGEFSENPANIAEKGVKSVVKYLVKQGIRGKVTARTIVYSLVLAFEDTVNSPSVESALRHAYNEIKDRKGKLTPDGNFVKEEDLK